MKRFTLFQFLWSLLPPLVSAGQQSPPPLAYPLAGQVYRQDFDGLPRSGTSSFSGKGPFVLAAAPVNGTGMEGWFVLQTGGSSTNAQLLTGTGSATTSGSYSFGLLGNNNRSLGSLASGSGIYAFGLLLSNQTGVTLDSCTLSFTMEQWRKGGSGQRNTYTFSYATGNLTPPFASDLTNIPALNLQSVVFTTGASTLNGKLPANQYMIRHTIHNLHWKPGEQLLLRWDDQDEPGNDDALAIDDFSFSASGIASVITMPPFVENVDMPAPKLYKAYDTLSFLVKFSKPVRVDTSQGIPALSLSIGTKTKMAYYEEGSHTDILRFLHIIQPGEFDNEGIRLHSPVKLNGSAISGLDSSNVLLSLSGFAGRLNDVRIDAIAPAVRSVAVPSPAVYPLDADLHFTVHFSKTVLVDTSAGIPSLIAIIGNIPRHVPYCNGTGSSELCFRYRISDGDLDKKGIRLGAALSLNGGIITDSAGNDAALVLKSIGSLSNVKADGIAPAFVKGTAVTLSLCNDASGISVAESLGATDLESGETLAWSLVSPPSSGSVSGLPASKISTRGILFPATVVYGPASSRVEKDSFVVQVTDGVNKAMIQFIVAAVTPVGENRIGTSQLICTGSKPAALNGSVALSEHDSTTYLWEYSTLSETNGYLPSPGIHHLPDYAPPLIETNTWFRRKMTTGACSSYSNSVAVTAMKEGLWLGNTNREWNNPNNWCGGHIPTTDTDVLILSSAAHFPHITTTASCNRLTLTGNAFLQISGTLQCKGAIEAGVESIDATHGGIELNGVLPQEVPANILTQQTIHHLIINNHKVYLKAPLIISGMLSCNKGRFETNGQLLLWEGSRIGPAAMESTISGNVNIAYRLPVRGTQIMAHPFSSDLDSTMMAPLSFNTSLSFFDDNAGYLSFDQNSAWRPVDHTAVTMESKWKKHQGLRLQVTDSTPRSFIVLSGQVNQGNQEIFFQPDQYTGYRLAVNPYACPVNMMHTSKSKNIAPYFWIWDNEQGLHGGYTSIPFKSHFMMPAFASFFIKTHAFTENHLLFTEQAKLTGELPDGFMELTDDPYHLELRLETDSLFWDRILLFHIDSARDATDPLDAEKIMNPDVSFYSFSSDKNMLSADARPFHKKTLIPLGIRSNLSGLFRIRTTRKYLPEKLVLYLHDKLLDRWMQLEKDSSYYFRLNPDTLNWQADRFEITAFKKEPVTITIPSKIRLEAGPVPARDQLMVNFKTIRPGNCFLRLFSIQGQLIRSYQLGVRQEGRFTISLAGIPQGLYILELQCADDTAVQRIIIGAG